MHYTCTPNSFSATVRRKIQRDQKGATAAALNACARAVTHAVMLTDAERKVDLGQYKRGWSFRRITAGAEFGNTIPYAHIIERGRRPGAKPPPRKALIGWVQRKFSVTEAQAKRIAYVLAQRIGQRGIPPFWIMRRTRQQAFIWYRAEIRKRFGK